MAPPLRMRCCIGIIIKSNLTYLLSSWRFPSSNKEELSRALAVLAKEGKNYLAETQPQQESKGGVYDTKRSGVGARGGRLLAPVMIACLLLYVHVYLQMHMLVYVHVHCTVTHTAL